MVKLLTIVALFLMITSCNHYTLVKENTFIPIPEIRTNNEWNCFVFDIESTTEPVARGKAFIADNKMWSARHIFSEQGYDVKELGCSDIKGLTLCREDHRNGDLFYFNTKINTVFMTCINEDRIEYRVANTAPILRGDSGSPVMCILHERVVGIVSKLYPLFLLEEDTDGYGGVITKMFPD